jgi:hypothetical protein
MEIGSANYDKNSSTRREFFKIKDGEQVFRILPPLGSMAKNGKWSRYMRVEWGYSDSNNKKKPFADIRNVNRKTGMVETESEAHLKREELKQSQSQAVAAFKAGKISKDQLDQMNKLVMNFSLESKHYVNAIDRNGKIGILKIGHKLKLAIDAEIEKLRSKGVDPLSVDNGRFFVIGRSGRGLDTTYSLSVLAEKIVHPELGEVEKPIVHKLDKSIIDRLAKEAMDLADLDKLYPTLTEEEVKRVVRGTPEDVTEVFNRFRNNTAESTPAEEDGPENESYSTVATTSVTTSAPVEETVSLAVGQTSAPVEEKLQVQTSPLQVSDDDFLASLSSLGIKS